MDDEKFRLLSQSLASDLVSSVYRTDGITPNEAARILRVVALSLIYSDMGTLQEYSVSPEQSGNVYIEAILDLVKELSEEALDEKCRTNLGEEL